MGPLDETRPMHLHACTLGASQKEGCFTFIVPCIQIFGGNGYNSEYPVEKLMRDAKIFQVRGNPWLLCCEPMHLVRVIFVSPCRFMKAHRRSRDASL